MYADIVNMEASQDMQSKLALLRDVSSADSPSTIPGVLGPVAPQSDSAMPQQTGLGIQTVETTGDGHPSFLNDSNAGDEPSLDGGTS